MFDITMAVTGIFAQGAWNNHMWDAGWGWWMGLLMVAFWGLVTWLIVSLTRGSGHRRERGEDPIARAQALLAERLARGEIDPAEYRERIDTLR